MRKFIYKSITYMIAIYAIIGGVTFFLIQTIQLLRPDSANAKMSELPLGRFNWGFVWSDTIIAGPALLVGGILMLIRNHSIQRLGQLFAFTGFAVNLYAMICILVGFWAINHPMQGTELWTNILLTLLGVFCMIRLGIQVFYNRC